MSSNHQPSLGQSIKQGVGLGIGLAISTAIIEALGPFGGVGILLMVILAPVFLGLIVGAAALVIGLPLGVFALGLVPFLLVYSLFTGDYSWGPDNPTHRMAVCGLGWMMALAYMTSGIVCFARRKQPKNGGNRGLAGTVLAVGGAWIVILLASALFAWTIDESSYRKSFASALQVNGRIGAVVGILYLAVRHYAKSGRNWAAAGRVIATFAVLTAAISAPLAFTFQGHNQTFYEAFKGWFGFLMIIAGFPGVPAVLTALLSEKGEATAESRTPKASDDQKDAEASSMPAEPCRRGKTNWWGLPLCAIGLGFIITGFVVGNAAQTLGPHIKATLPVWFSLVGAPFLLAGIGLLAGCFASDHQPATPELKVTDQRPRDAKRDS